MHQYVLITAVGRDRPGLVAGVTEALLDGGCNVEDSSMTRLGGDFAMILLVRHEAETSEPIRARLDRAAGALGLNITVRDLSEADVHAVQDEGASFHLSVYGADRAGIVHAIAVALADRGASITDLRTTLAGTDEKPIYVMQMEAVTPEGQAETLPAAVTEAAAALGVEIAVRRMDPVAL